MPHHSSKLNQYQAVIFDLDGTLIDSLQDLGDAMNELLAQDDHASIELNRYRYLVGQGVDRLVQDAYAERGITLQGEALNNAVATFKPIYARRKYNTTDLYPGIAAMLDQLIAKQIKLGILSNKPHPATLEMVNQLCNHWPFDVIRGHNADAPPKPDPTSAQQLTAQLKLNPDQIIYVGDTRVDMLTGKAAGFYTVGVAWGFRPVDELEQSGADQIIQTPDELLTMF